ncbi:MAG: HEAT repeat domain-containing protein [Chloroflexota bacterium]
MIRYCSRCWGESAWEATVCAHCGTSLEEEAEGFVDKLIAAVRHPEPTRAGLAIHILGERLREPRAVAPLIALLDQTRDPYLLRSAVEALGRLGDTRAVSALSRLLHDPSASVMVRVAAAQALAQIGGKVAIEALSALPPDVPTSVEGAAQQALTELRERQVGQE